MKLLLDKQAVCDLGLLVLGSCFYTLAFPPHGRSGAAWLTLAPLFLVLRGKTPKAAFTCGFLFGVFSCIGVTTWVHFTIASYFPLGFPLDVVCTLLSYAFFGGIPMGCIALVSCLLAPRLSQPAPTRTRASACWLGLPALWVSGEYVRSSVIPGFSWGILGYSQFQHLPLIQVADLTGVHGLSFLIALSGYVVAEVLIALGVFRSSGFTRQNAQRLPWPAFFTLTAGFTMTLLYGILRLRPDVAEQQLPPLKVALVRGSIPSEHRWQPIFHGSTLTTYITLTRSGVSGTHPHLVVWPEFAVGFYPDHEPRLQAQLSWLAQELKAPLFIGAPRLETFDETERYYNSAYLIAPGQGIVDIYDKIHLVPFAEYRPLALPGFTVHNADHPSEFTAGERSTIFSLRQGTFGALICYEATYPYLARRLARGGAEFLINISNDSWLKAGGEEALEQHFAMAVFRAVENRRFLVRVATDGVSGFIDAYGRPFQLSTANEGVIAGQVTPNREVTVYTRYGDWFALGCIGFALLACLWNARPAAVERQTHKERDHAS